MAFFRGEMMIGVLVAGGELENKELFKKYIEKADFSVAVDSGAKVFFENKILPNLLVGDLDSIDKESLKYFKENNIKIDKYPCEKDLTDLEIGLNSLINNGCDKLYALGTIGSRIDHSVANIMILKKMYDLGYNCYMINDKNRVQYIEANKEVSIKKDYENISIIPLSEKGINVTLIGFYYTITDYEMELGSTTGISNYLVKDFGTIKLNRGRALIIESND